MEQRTIEEDEIQAGTHKMNLLKETLASRRVALAEVVRPDWRSDKSAAPIDGGRPFFRACDGERGARRAASCCDQQDG